MQIALNFNSVHFGFLCADLKNGLIRGKDWRTMGEPFASPRTVGFVSGNRSLAPLSCPRCPSLRRDKTRGSGHVPAQLRVWGTLRAGGGVLRPWGEPSLSVHLALPAPLVSKVVYVKIKPLEIQTCLHLCEDPTASRRQPPRPAPSGVRPSFTPPRPFGSGGSGGTAAGSAGAGAKAASPLAPVPPLDPPMTS